MAGTLRYLSRRKPKSWSPFRPIRVWGVALTAIARRPWLVTKDKVVKEKAACMIE